MIFEGFLLVFECALLYFLAWTAVAEMFLCCPAAEADHWAVARVALRNKRLDAILKDSIVGSRMSFLLYFDS